MSDKRECPVCRRAISLRQDGAIRSHGHRAAPCLGSGEWPRVRTVREAVGGEPPWLADMEALRNALVRLLWRSMVDRAECACADYEGDGKHERCAECQAMAALGLGRWLGAEDAARRLPSAVTIEEQGTKEC